MLSSTLSQYNHYRDIILICVGGGSGVGLGAGAGGGYLEAGIWGSAISFN
tara:strand:+ start:260 stop:409 length:150 start_codon:yes stop_codon:yes gene_type:complete